MKLVLNKQFGGYNLSQTVIMLYAERVGKKLYAYYQDYGRDNSSGVYYVRDKKKVTLMGDFPLYQTKDYGDVYYFDYKGDHDKWSSTFFDMSQVERDDETLIEIVEQLGAGANGFLADLRVVEIPDGSYYHIDEYDGYTTNNVLHSITITPSGDFVPSQKILVYISYDKSDVFSDMVSTVAFMISSSFRLEVSLPTI